MATTTYAAIRDLQVTAIRAIAPTSHAGELFKVATDEGNFRDWARANPQACFRRFTVRYLSEDEPEASNLDAEYRTVEAEIVVAYPGKTPAKWGSENLRDMSDIMREDAISLNNAAGHRGYSNITVAATIISSRPVYEGEDGDAVRFLVLPYTCKYWEAV